MVNPNSVQSYTANLMSPVVSLICETEEEIHFWYNSVGFPA